MKTILKLAIAALLANAGWHASQAWLSYFKFKDAVTQTSQFGGDLSMSQLHGRVMELGAQYSLPVTDDSFTIRRNETHHTFIDGSYVQPIDLFPGYQYPWTADWHVDTFSEKAPKLDESVPK